MVPLNIRSLTVAARLVLCSTGKTGLNRSPIEFILLRPTPEKIASSHRLFVSSQSVLGEKSKAAVKTDEDVSLYTMVL
ncbi:hypothetical protein Lwal_1290 [Legionella waltersii]|uniref:Uncharacterized protein n=1 Tax=Legionella waltersii TaxID=66969 RepID=A0A0W1ACZ8_9GAMM|nr:hypothetical protein Lwal_1290 [Legionella waltersii]SNV12578.1 Uncharacterised protein [Legionella waltersii]